MNYSSNFTNIKNGQSISLNEVSELNKREFLDTIVAGVNDNKRLLCFFADQELYLYAVLANDINNSLSVGMTQLSKCHYASITPKCMQANLFEREIAEQFGIIPDGHPWLKPVRSQELWSLAVDIWNRNGIIKPGEIDFYQVSGDEIHEVGVGPVHAGVIEPGHFRFQCHSEIVLHLEIALGFQHRGIERAFIGGPNFLNLKQVETIAGDSTIAHTWAYCNILESLSNLKSQMTPNINLMRGVVLELERMANHIGDLGALAGDVGFLPTASFCGRIRGEWLNMTADICGSRLGRNCICPGGLYVDIDDALINKLLIKLEVNWNSTKDAIELLFNSASVLSRFKNTGILSSSQAIQIGLVGVPARACGLNIDVRKNYAHGPYIEHSLKISVNDSGDVYSRALVRWLELQESYNFLYIVLCKLSQDIHGNHDKLIFQETLKNNNDSLCVSMIEGWRGEVVHIAITDNFGKFKRYKIVDPSFHNWFGLALAMREQQISDFPLCNKSFNLSYCGYDL